MSTAALPNRYISLGAAEHGFLFVCKRMMILVSSLQVFLPMNALLNELKDIFFCVNSFMFLCFPCHTKIA